MMQTEERYGELDALRGIAVLGMVLYHVLFDLSFFYGWNIPVAEGWWKDIARATAALFFLLVGICFVISRERASSTRNVACHPEPFGELRVNGDEGSAATLHSAQHDTLCSLYPKYLRRGFVIFTGGMLITLVTYAFSPTFYVKFGVLHFIGISALLQPFFAPLKLRNVLLGLLVITFPLPRVAPLGGAKWGHFLFPLGLPPPGFSSLDYYPLVPWFGVILLGMALGASLYVPERHRSLAPLKNVLYPRALLWAGRSSLWIYFVHQPVILLLLSLIFGMPVQR